MKAYAAFLGLLGVIEAFCSFVMFNAGGDYVGLGVLFAGFSMAAFIFAGLAIGA